VPLQFSLSESLNIAMDGGSPVDSNYQLPFEFTRTIEKVIIDLK
jgi:arylsulfatase